jgi:thioredoxin 1
MTERVVNVTDATFATEVEGAGLPVLLDMWAPWCAPCLMLGPVLQELAEEHAETLRVCKLNVDENPETAAKLGVSAIPTVVLFAGGKEAHRLIGVQPKWAYLEAVRKAQT